MKQFTYRSNNSGGGWWLNDNDWKSLEKAGWKVDWREDRWLGALATTARGEFNSEEDAIDSFETATGQIYTDEGCSCCGEPHYISEE